MNKRWKRPREKTDRGEDEEGSVTKPVIAGRQREEREVKETRELRKSISAPTGGPEDIEEADKRPSRSLFGCLSRSEGVRKRNVEREAEKKAPQSSCFV